jgi:hypothetical protein
LTINASPYLSVTLFIFQSLTLNAKLSFPALIDPHLNDTISLHHILNPTIIKWSVSVLWDLWPLPTTVKCCTRGLASTRCYKSNGGYHKIHSNSCFSKVAKNKNYTNIIWISKYRHSCIMDLTFMKSKFIVLLEYQNINTVVLWIWLLWNQNLLYLCITDMSKSLINIR